MGKNSSGKSRKTRKSPEKQVKVPHRCCADNCTNTEDLVRLPTSVKDSRSSEEGQKKKDDTRRSWLRVLWVPSQHGGIEKAVEDGRRLFACTRHGKVGEQFVVTETGRYKVVLGSTPLKRDEAQQHKAREEQKRVDNLAGEDARAKRRCLRQELRHGAGDEPVVKQLEAAEERLVRQIVMTENLIKYNNELQARIAALEEEKKAWEEREKRLKEEAERERALREELAKAAVPRFTMAWVLEDDDRVKQFTGFAGAESLEAFVRLCYYFNLQKHYDSREGGLPADFGVTEQMASQVDGVERKRQEHTSTSSPKSSKKGPKPKLGFQDALCMTLTQFRQYVPFYFLGHIFGVKRSTANKRFMKVTNLLERLFTDPESKVNPLYQRDFTKDGFASWKRMGCFDGFPNCAVVADCTEVFTQTPQGSIYKKIFFSHYKHHETVKILVFIDTRGNVVYVSKTFPGRISDGGISIEVANNAADSVFSRLWEGSGIMVDKGFGIKDLAKKYKLTVIIPPRCAIGRKFTAEQLQETREVARSRIHVERAIRRAKIYKILQDEVPVATIPNYSSVARVCFYLSNFLSLLVDEEDDEYSEVNT